MGAGCGLWFGTDQYSMNGSDCRRVGASWCVGGQRRSAWIRRTCERRASAGSTLDDRGSLGTEARSTMEPVQPGAGWSLRSPSGSLVRSARRRASYECFGRHRYDWHGDVAAVLRFRRRWRSEAVTHAVGDELGFGNDGENYLSRAMEAACDRTASNSAWRPEICKTVRWCSAMSPRSTSRARSVRWPGSGTVGEGKRSEPEIVFAPPCDRGGPRRRCGRHPQQHRRSRHPGLPA